MTLFAFGFVPGPMEMAIFGIIAVLLFGNRLPGVARALGSSLNEFKKGVKDVQDDAAVISGEVKSASKTVGEVTDLKN